MPLRERLDELGDQQAADKDQADPEVSLLLVAVPHEREEQQWSNRYGQRSQQGVEAGEQDLAEEALEQDEGEAVAAYYSPAAPGLVTHVAAPGLGELLRRVVRGVLVGDERDVAEVQRLGAADTEQRVQPREGELAEQASTVQLRGWHGGSVVFAADQRL